MKINDAKTYMFRNVLSNHPYYFATAYGANFGKELNNKLTINVQTKIKELILYCTKPIPNNEKLKNIVKKHWVHQ